jgi:sulfite reductase (NADPH) flavoprotein alpha-component
MALDPDRLLAAACVLLAWLALCGWTLGRAWRRRESGTGTGRGLLVVHASQTGFAEDLARRSAEMLRQAWPGSGVAALGGLDAAALATAGQVLFVVSTTGEGDAPDSAARFAGRVMAGPADLSGLRYGMLALGDRGYAQFCAFGRGVEAWLRRNGATPLFERIEMDDGDEAALRDWQAQLGRLAGVSPPVWAQRDFAPWRLAERRLLNPGSLGGPVYHLALEPSGPMPAWCAGDIAEIRPPAAGDGQSPHRDYSIASLPRDGRLELLVRLMRRPDGTPGLGSGWLTQAAPLGGSIALRIRGNSAFHAPDPARPLILVGNGTGLAGLRAHLRARRAAGARRNWLIFGERMRAHDFLHGTELRAMLAEGTLQRLDLAFSRDQPERRYVQDLVREAAPELRRWIADGAAIMVSGSLAGMAPGVQAALAEVLGAEGLAALTEAGRYRRDVY